MRRFEGFVNGEKFTDVESFGKKVNEVLGDKTVHEYSIYSHYVETNDNKLPDEKETKTIEEKVEIPVVIKESDYELGPNDTPTFENGKMEFVYPNPKFEDLIAKTDTKVVEDHLEKVSSLANMVDDVREKLISEQNELRTKLIKLEDDLKVEDAKFDYYTKIEYLLKNELDHRNECDCGGECKCDHEDGCKCEKKCSCSKDKNKTLIDILDESILEFDDLFRTLHLFD